MTVRHNKHTSLPVLLPVGVSKDPQTTHTFVQFHYTNRHCTAIKLSKAQVPHTVSYSASPTAPMCNVIEYRTEGAFGGQALMGLSKMRTSFPLSLSPPALSPSPSHPAFSPSALLQRSVLSTSALCQNLPAPQLPRHPYVTTHSKKGVLTCWKNTLCCCCVATACVETKQGPVLEQKQQIPHASGLRPFAADLLGCSHWRQLCRPFWATAPLSTAGFQPFTAAQLSWSYSGAREI